MEFGAGAERAIVPGAHRLGHAARLVYRAKAAGPPELSRETREEEVPAVEQDREPQQRAARRTQYYGCVLLCPQ